MTNNIRRTILRANALYIGGAALAGLVFDIRGYLFGVGPQGRILTDAPYAAIGFVEAHGLALILSVLLWRAAPTRSWLLTAMAMEVLLGTANVVFWEMFVVNDALLLGYVTTALHWSFALAQSIAATLPDDTDHVSLRFVRSPEDCDGEARCR
jgi:hypothetical protein